MRKVRTIHLPCHNSDMNWHFGKGLYLVLSDPSSYRRVHLSSWNTLDQGAGVWNLLLHTPSPHLPHQSGLSPLKWTTLFCRRTQEHWWRRKGTILMMKGLIRSFGKGKSCALNLFHQLPTMAGNFCFPMLSTKCYFQALNPFLQQCCFCCLWQESCLKASEERAKKPLWTTIERFTQKRNICQLLSMCA